VTLTTRRDLPPHALTPTIRTFGRTHLYWAIVGVALIIIALVSFMFSGATQFAGPSLSPSDASPTGSKALAEVLRNQGVVVTEAYSLSQVRDAATDPTGTTVFIIDDEGYLGARALHDLVGLSSNLVIMSPTFDQLELLAPEVANAGHVEGTLDADCSLPLVRRAESVTGDGTGFRLIEANSGAIECFSSGDDVHSLIQVRHGEKLVTVIGTRNAFSNEFVQFQGNAAVALGLLGETPNLVWLLPSIDEASAVDGATIAELTPPWVSTIMMLLAIAVIAAGFWRGRRFGPLVAETLPVTVRASETMHGRARLYQKASDHLHVLDALRMGTIDRLGVLCGLPTVASVDDVIRAVADVTRQQPAHIAQLLRDAEPQSEAELIGLSDSLLRLESATATATRPSSATMDSTVTTTVTTTEPKGPTR
jgi:hypothetical protein